MTPWDPDDQTPGGPERPADVPEVWSHVPNLESFLQELYTRSTGLSTEPTSAQFSALSARVAANSAAGVDLSALSQAVSVLSQQVSTLSQSLSSQAAALSVRIDTQSQGLSVLSQQVSALSQRLSGLSVIAGNLQISGVLSVVGGQIGFPAIAVPSAGVNVLDEYEEGTWTGTIGGTATYTVNTGKYIKVGRIVYAFMDFQLLSVGTGSLTTIGGLPFTNDNISSGGFVTYFAALATNVATLMPQIDASTTSVFFESTGGAVSVAADHTTVFQNGTRIIFAVVYPASA